MVDYPGAAYWREIADHYPDAKVLHTVRDPDKWFDSTQATIFAPQARTRRPAAARACASASSTASWARCASTSTTAPG